MRFDGPTEGLPDKVLWGYMSATKNPEILIEYNFEKQAINTPPSVANLWSTDEEPAFDATRRHQMTASSTF